MKNLIMIFAMIVIAQTVNAQSAFDQLMTKKADALICALKVNAQATQDVKVSIDKQTEAISTGILLTGQYQEKDLALKAQANKIAKTGNVIAAVNTGVNATGVILSTIIGANTVSSIDRLTSVVAQNQVQPRPWVTNQGGISSYGGYVNSGGQQWVANGITAGNPGVGVGNTGTVGGGYWLNGVWYP